MRKYTSLPYTELSVSTGNYDESRVKIDRIVLHTMVGTWSSAAARFGQYGTQVSAHYGVKYDGGLIAWLEEYYTAYHSGNYAMNQRSIGIEHEDMGNYNSPRPDALYKTSAKLVADICKFYGIPCDAQHVIRHNQIIPTGCPDALDTNRIVAEAQKILNPPTPTPPNADQYVSLAKKDMQSVRNWVTTGLQVGDPQFKAKMTQVRDQALSVYNDLK